MRMKRRRRHAGTSMSLGSEMDIVDGTADGATDVFSTTDELVRYWCLKILFDLNIIKKLNTGIFNFLDDQLIEFLGIDNAIDDNEDSKELRKIILTKYRETKAKNGQDTVIWENIQKLKSILNYSEIDCEIFLFGCLANSYNVLENLLDTFGDVNSKRLSWILSRILDRDEREIFDSLKPGSRLLRSGILKIDIETIRVARKFGFLDDFNERIIEHRHSVKTMIEPLVTETNGTHLTEKNYKHISAEISTLKRYLKNVYKTDITGANILLYGPPGTGKTELVKLVAQVMNLSLFEVICNDEDDDFRSKRSRDRLSAYQVALKVLSNTPNALIMFDEIEDVFPKQSFFSSHNDVGKAKVNKLLETNGVPTFWLSNSVGQLDPAWVRRFDIVIELNEPDLQSRKELLRGYTEPLGVSKKWLHAMSQIDDLTPAELERSVRVVNLCGFQGEKAEKLIVTSLNDSRKAADNPLINDPSKKEKSKQTAFSETQYRHEFSESDADLEKILQALKKSKEGRILFYGPPGTGKTALAHHIAALLKRPLHAKKASDLVSKWVGETEKNIASVFKQATIKKAVLLIDEADSLIHDRATHDRSWQTSQVNEMLVQMEQFNGIFIASTNLIEKLDKASARRFDFKIKFDYLPINKAVAMFVNTLKTNGYRRNIDMVMIERELTLLQHITPSAYAVAVRKARIYGEKLSPELLLETIRVESAMINMGNDSRPIGFLH